MSQAFAHELGFKIWKTNIEVEKIDNTTLETYGIVVSTFFVLDENGRKRFFEESFLLTDVKLEIMLEMLFLTISNANVDLQTQNLQWRSYTTEDILSTTKQVKLIEKKEFATVTLDLEHKAFIIYIATLSVKSGNEMHPLKKTQIAYLKIDEASSKVPCKYADFADVFLLKLATEFPKYIRINNPTIKLVDDWQPPYNLIYSLGPLELETLKAYIKNNLANDFIRLSKSFARTSIFFDKKPNSCLRLCVDYWGLNNLTIKNRYLLPLIGESLNWLDWAWRFT